jgi:protein-tyrosine phosphatase
MILLFPFLFYSWGLWHLVRLLHRIHSREAYASEIVPGIWLSRRILRHEVPAGVTCVVDMTCEFPAARGLVKSVACYCVLPTLDYGTPAPREAVALIEKLRGHGGGILVHCAQGHGRSALLAAALLIGLGKAMDADEALAVVKRGRPNARLTPRQMAALREIVGSLAKPGTAVLDEDN